MKKVKCEIYSRVCGFYRPVSQFNKGKKEEYRERKEYVIGDFSGDIHREDRD